MTTNDAALAARIRLLRNHGSETKYYHQTVGGNFRLDALQAAVLRREAAASRRVDRRPPPATPRAIAGCSRPMRPRAAGVTLGVGLAEPTPPGDIVLPAERPDALHIYNQFVIRAGTRDGLRAHLDRARHRHGGLLSRAVPSAGLFRGPRI